MFLVEQGDCRSETKLKAEAVQLHFTTLICSKSIFLHSSTSFQWRKEWRLFLTKSEAITTMLFASVSMASNPTFSNLILFNLLIILYLSISFSLHYLCFMLLHRYLNYLFAFVFLQAIKTQEQMNRKILANTYGSAFPLKMDLDRQILSRFLFIPSFLCLFWNFWFCSKP